MKSIITIAVITVTAGWLIYRNHSHSESAPSRPAETSRSLPTPSTTRESSMEEVLQLARRAREAMSTNLHDYTARFVKQELDRSGVLNEQSEVLMKIQTRLRNDSDDAPKRVYLKFTRPEDVSGREVIWGEDLYGGKMQVKEAGLLGMMTISLDPNGMIAMRGQRYPISEIGMVRLVEKLIERGEQDLDNPDITVTVSDDHRVGETPANLITVRRKKPSGTPEDFSLAEIAYDPQRQLILSYRSFGWPPENVAGVPQDGDAPLQESYTYYDVKTNVGLTDQDFSITNPEYSFP